MSFEMENTIAIGISEVINCGIIDQGEAQHVWQTIRKGIKWQIDAISLNKLVIECTTQLL